MQSITNGRLAEIVTALLTNPFCGRLDDQSSFEAFFSDVARLVCKHCGGRVAEPVRYVPEPGNMDWATHYRVGVQPDESSPDNDIWTARTALAAQLAAPSDEGGADHEPPTAVIEINGGAFYCARATHAMRIIVVDEDIEGGDGNNIMGINGEDAYVHDYRLIAPAESGQDGIDAGFVRDIVTQIDGGGQVAPGGREGETTNAGLSVSSGN